MNTRILLNMHVNFASLVTISYFTLFWMLLIVGYSDII